MTPEDKQLLLIDLCTRLPYGVRIQVKEWTTVDTELKVGHIDRLQYDEIKVKPYLRPISSITEEEAKELLFIRLASKYGESCAYIKNFIKLYEVSFQKEPPYVGSIAVWFSFKNKSHEGPQMREYGQVEYLGRINDITLAEIDWFNAHHFDYRDLIEKSLALEAPDDIYEINKK